VQRAIIRMHPLNLARVAKEGDYAPRSDGEDTLPKKKLDILKLVGGCPRSQLDQIEELSTGYWVHHGYRTPTQTPGHLVGREFSIRQQFIKN
jgi:hypothetical protein